MGTFVVALAVVTLAPALPARAAQRPDSLGAQVKEYVRVDTALLALTHVPVIDGTGGGPRPDQTVVIRQGKLEEVGPAPTVHVPAGVRTMDLSGSTVIPGLVGMHDHLFYTAAGGRFAQMSYTGPRLYLAAGVTTIRTTGSRSPYAEINLKDQIDRGLEPGPRLHITAPYITAPQRGPTVAVPAAHHHVSMPSARAVAEPCEANRPTKDARVLQAMAPEVRQSYMKIRQEIDSGGHGPITLRGLQNAMAFERAFVAAGGLLGAGVDPTGIGGALAGWGDPRNYTILSAAGVPRHPRS